MPNLDRVTPLFRAGLFLGVRGLLFFGVFSLALLHLFLDFLDIDPYQDLLDEGR